VTTPSDPRILSESDDERLDAWTAWAARLANGFCLGYRITGTALADDVAQTAYETMLVARPRHDNSKAPFEVFAYRRVTGAMIRLVKSDRAYPASERAADDDGLDEAGSVADIVTNPFAEEESDAPDEMKGIARRVMFRRILGSTRVKLAERPDDVLFRMEVLAALRRACGGLSEREETVINLRYWQEKTWDEIGEAIGLDKRQAQRIDEKLRERLKRKLKRDGVDAPPSSRP
jgi:RNA polymerase sigma factor (sigma-70 family)